MAKDTLGITALARLIERINLEFKKYIKKDIIPDGKGLVDKKEDGTFRLLQYSELADEGTVPLRQNGGSIVVGDASSDEHAVNRGQLNNEIKKILEEYPPSEESNKQTTAEIIDGALYITEVIIE